MFVLSEMLAFPHHDCARGSKVERPFLEDLVLSLGYQGERLSSKDRLLVKAVQLATGAIPGVEVLSTGGTVKDDTLEIVINGVVERGLAKVSLVEGAPAARIAAARAQAHPEVDWFDPLDLDDDRKEGLRAVKVRSGQGPFRERVLKAYGSRCAVTRCDVTEALEAAHITPYRGSKSNVISNGVCLRADLHRLWDTGRLAVDESTHHVLLDAAMIGTAYSEYAGTKIDLPADPGDAPSSLALEHQRLWAGL
jgi:hypothetical protein